MGTTLIPTGTLTPIEVEPLKRGVLGTLVTGATNIKAKVRRDSDGLYLDWSDMTFKASPTQLLEDLAEVDATNFPGEYQADLDLPAVTNLNDHDIYQVTVVEDGSSIVANLPQVGEVQVSQALDDAIKSRKSLYNRQALSDGSTLNLVLYDDDGTTVLQRWNIRDKAATDILISPNAPAIREPQ